VEESRLVVVTINDLEAPGIRKYPMNVPIESDEYLDEILDKGYKRDGVPIVKEHSFTKAPTVNIAAVEPKGSVFDDKEEDFPVESTGALAAMEEARKAHAKAEHIAKGLEGRARKNPNFSNAAEKARKECDILFDALEEATRKFNARELT